MKKIGTAIVCAAGWWGCAALGDDHNETVDCFFYPAHCQGGRIARGNVLSGALPGGMRRAKRLSLRGGPDWWRGGWLQYRIFQPSRLRA